MPAWLEESVGEVAAAAQHGMPRSISPRRVSPGTSPVAIAGIDTLRAALALAGAAARVDLSTHQLLDHILQQQAQQIRAELFNGPAQRARGCRLDPIRVGPAQSSCPGSLPVSASVMQTKPAAALARIL